MAVYTVCKLVVFCIPIEIQAMRLDHLHENLGVAMLAESPLWLDDLQEFLWLDLLGRCVHRLDPTTGCMRTIVSAFEENLACAVKCTNGRVLLVSASAFWFLDPGSGKVTSAGTPLRPRSGTCFNDGKVAPDGALWIGSSDIDEVEPLGSLFRIKDGHLSTVDHGFAVANGPAFSPDGRFAYFADTLAGNLLRYGLDASGEPDSRVHFASVPPEDGYPDGLTVDATGRIFSAHWQGSRITVYSNNGQVLDQIRFGLDNITSCAFGGKAHDLLIVSAAGRETGDSPHLLTKEGGVYLLACGSKGISEPVFRV